VQVVPHFNAGAWVPQQPRKSTAGWMLVSSLRL